MGDVTKAVIFDFYGTLAHWADGDASSYETVFAAFGYELPQAVRDGYFSLYDGVDHAEHSVSEDAYEAWVRHRLGELTRVCGVDANHREPMVDALRSLDQHPMVAYEEAAETLATLRGSGLAVGVCSNWGWELDAYLEKVGLLDLVDCTITSARAGSRKPHPGIYECSLKLLGIRAEQAIFAGDSWEPDVRGPRRMGMGAVHVWRPDERVGQQPPPLEPGDVRVGDLTGVASTAGVAEGVVP